MVFAAAGAGRVSRLDDYFATGYAAVGAGRVFRRDEVALRVLRTAVVGFALFFAVMRCNLAGRVAGTLSVGGSAFGEVAFWRAMVLRFVRFASDAMSVVARRAPGDQGTGLALGNRLRKGKCERRHQGD